MGASYKVPSGHEVENGFNYAVDVLKKLISIPTVSPQGDHYEEAAEYLASELTSLGFDVEVIRVAEDYQHSKCRNASSNPRFIVLGKRGDSGPTLHFNGHYDVVPGGPGWTVTEPFKPVIREGRLYGRGAVDMKGGIAAVLGAFKALKDAGVYPPLRLEAAFVPDEEIGGECGTGYLVNEIGIRPEYVILPEPSGLDAPWKGHRGILWLKVRVSGRTAHASTPWLGRNAFLMAARLALELQSFVTSVYSSRRSKYKIDPEDARMPTAMIGGVAEIPGKGKANQVPGEFVFTIDRRLIPEENVEAARSELVSAIRWIAVKHGLSENDYHVEEIISAEPAINEPGELYEALREATRIAGREIGEATICPGGLDMWYYTTKGSKALAYGPSYHLAHAPDEYIDLSELRFLVKTFSLLPFTLAQLVPRGS